MIRSQTPTSLPRRWTVLLVVLLTLTGCDALLPPDPALLISLDGTEIRQTTINDGLVQAGEYVVVDFFLTNVSDSAYVNVGPSATSPGPVRALQAHGPGPGRGFDRIEPGQSFRVIAEFQLDPNTPTGTAVPLTVTLTTPGEISVSFSTTLSTSALPYTGAAEDVAVSEDTDGDGQVEPGEEARVRFTPQFTGGSSSPSTCGGYRVTTTLAQVVILGVTDGSCAGGGERSFRFRASSTLPSGTTLPFVITLSDGLGNTWDTPVAIPLG